MVDYGNPKSIERLLKKDLVQEVYDLAGENSVLAESYEQAAAALLSIQTDDVGWSTINSMREHDGFVIHHLHDIYKKAKLQTKGNPLLKRGFTLRCSYVWGRGIEIVGDIPPRFQQKIDKNWDVLFSQSAFISNERSLFNAGQFFLAYDKRTDTAYPISFSRITNFAANPDRPSDVWYYQHTYQPIDPSTNQPQDQAVVEWYPVAETADRSGKGLLKTITNQPVNPHIVIIDVRVNRDEDEIWGVPDVLPAMPYAWAHTEYIRDASRLLKALSTIAWKVVSKSKGNANAAAVKMAGTKGAANTASMTADTDLVAMPKSGQVDMADGDRIASYVAAALGVSLTGLLSTAGAAGGSFGAEASLDLPSQNDALSRQAIWMDYYARVLRVMGIKPGTGTKVVFRSISEDPAFRTLQGLTTIYTNGGISQEEYRDAVLTVMDVKPASAELPKPNAFTGAKTIKPDLPSETQLEIAQMQIDSQQKLAKQAQATAVKVAAAKPATATPTAAKPNNSPDPNSRQGNTGAAGKMSDSNNDLRDMSHKAGTGNTKP